jgi:succinyl-diaminopimelate desuccinylase
MKYDSQFWLNQATRYKDELITETIRLISFQSVGKYPEDESRFPYGQGNADCLDYMLNKAKHDGFFTKNYDYHAGVIQYGNATNALGIVCHLDVVDADPTQWKHDPFDGIVDHGVIFGRGSNDSKGPTMAAYLALKIVADLNIKLQRCVHLILGCNEESGMKCIDHYLKVAPQIPDIGFVPDCTFPVNFGEHGCAVFEISLPRPDYLKQFSSYLHKHVISGLAKAVVNHIDNELINAFNQYLDYYGLLGYVDSATNTLILEGKSAHGSRPHESTNASTHLLNFIACHFKDETLKQLVRKLFREDGSGLNVYKSSYRFGSLSIAVTGTLTDLDHLRIFLDCRYPTDIIIDDIARKLQQEVQSISNDMRSTLSENSEGFFVDPQSFLPVTLLDIYRTYYPEDPSYGKVSAGDTYARKFSGKYLGFGPTTRMHLSKKYIGQAHQPNEGMEIETLIKAVAIYCDAIYRLAK